MHHIDNLDKIYLQGKAAFVSGNCRPDNNGNVFFKIDGYKVTFIKCKGHYVLVEKTTGVLVRGRYIEGKKQGWFISYLKDSGLTNKAFFVNDEIVRYISYYLSTGQKWFDISYRNNKKHGTSIYYSQEGEEASSIIIYDNGEIKSMKKIKKEL